MLKPFAVLGALLAIGFLPQKPVAQSTPPSAPADASAAVNPVKPTPETLARAKKMYGYDCAMCHGENGNGKGDLVADMKLSLKDYSDPASLKDVSDGEIYNIIKNGKGQMSGEGDRAKSTDIWSIVLLVRSFARK